MAAQYHTPEVPTQPSITYFGNDAKIIRDIDEGKKPMGFSLHTNSPEALVPDKRYVNNPTLNEARANVEKWTQELVEAAKRGPVAKEMVKLYHDATSALHDVHFQIKPLPIDSSMHAAKDIETAHSKTAAKLGMKFVTLTALVSAVTQANATEGTLMDKAAVFAEVGVDAIPGVTAAKKFAHGEKEAAALDAAGYAPGGILTGIARSPEVQAVIDNLPSNNRDLEKMRLDPKTPYIDRHLAETKTIWLDARDKGEFIKGLEASNRLSNLAEQRVTLQQKWTDDATTLKQALKNPQTDWANFAEEHPSLTGQAAVKAMAIKQNLPDGMMAKVDENLVHATQNGIPVEVKVDALQVAMNQAVHESN